jgi:hypothetical protein
MSTCLCVTAACRQLCRNATKSPISPGAMSGGGCAAQLNELRAVMERGGDRMQQAVPTAQPALHVGIETNFDRSAGARTIVRRAHQARLRRLRVTSKASNLRIHGLGLP